MAAVLSPQMNLAWLGTGHGWRDVMAAPRRYPPQPGWCRRWPVAAGPRPARTADRPGCRCAGSSARAGDPTGAQYSSKSRVDEIGAHDLTDRGQKRLYRAHIEAIPYVAFVVDDLVTEPSWAPRGISVRGLALIHPGGRATRSWLRSHLGRGHLGTGQRVGIDTSPYEPPNNRKVGIGVARRVHRPRWGLPARSGRPHERTGRSGHRGRRPASTRTRSTRSR